MIRNTQYKHNILKIIKLTERRKLFHVGSYYLRCEVLCF